MSRPLTVGVTSSAATLPYAEHLGAEDGFELVVSDPAGGVEALMAQRPDAVVIGGEGPDILDAARAASAGGAHILLAGPIATTTADAEEVVRLAAEAGVVLVTGSPLRFTDAFRTLAARVGRGDVGEVLGVVGSSPDTVPVDLLDILIGEPASWVRAVDVRFRDEKDGAGARRVITIGFPSGSFATIDGPWSASDAATETNEVRLQVSGTLGSIELSDGRRHIGLDTADGLVRLPFGEDPCRSMIRHFLACIRDDLATESDGTAGLRMTRIAEAAREAAATGQTVRIPA